MKAIYSQIIRVGLILAVFAIVATSLVTLTEENTHDKILDNERQTLLNAINVLVNHNNYNNDILADTLILGSNKLLGTRETTIAYRARLDSKPIAVILTAIAPDGYNGNIKLLVGINYDGSLAGVRVISHKETPGLGDKINEKKADWILKFNNLSLQNPELSKWKVKKDGGHFDQFTGATITPRAVVTAVKKALQYFDQRRDALFEEAK
ncbi:MAG: electron transport complex subunit RsxG [Piscirickettsiaceae bacterium]|nr:electron transport complex subunit RsxG [Piscirickettsiaceae bacterium]